MAVTRRTFLKIAASAAAATATGGFAAVNYLRKSRNAIARAVKKRGVCPYCPAHCQMQNFYKGDDFVYSTGCLYDKSSAGMLCTKGIILPYQKKNKDTLGEVLYVKNGHIQPISYAAAIELAADRLRRLRDESFVVKNGEEWVNRTDAIVTIGGASLTNEEAYQCAKFSRAIGVRDSFADSAITSGQAQAEIATYGIPAQQNPIYDIQNSDAVLVIASNPVRSCAAIAGHIMTARDRGAKIIAVDPLRSECASIADIHLKIIPGTDAVLLAGMINYFFRNCRADTEYLADNTDAGFLVSDDFSFATDGTFSGYDPVIGAYTDTSSWSYVIDERGNPRLDKRIARDKCVLSHLEKYYSRFTPDYVVRETGVNGGDFLAACEAFCATSAKEMSGSVVFGAPLARSFSSVRLINILQLLCANIGISGGGIFNASSSLNHQGVQDQMYEGSLPGYLPLPSGNDNYESWIRENGLQVNVQESPNLRRDFAEYFTELANAWYGESSPEKAFKFLPRRHPDWQPSQIFQSIDEGSIRGLLLFESEILASSSPDTLKKILEKLDLLILCSPFDKARRAVRYMPLKGEGFIFPVASLGEKRGSITSPDRRISRLAGLHVTKGLRSTLSAVTDLFRSVRSLYLIDGGAWPEPLLAPAPLSGSSVKVHEELSGTAGSFCGNWLYSARNRSSYKASPAGSTLTLWGEPWLYSRCALTPERTLRTGKAAPSVRASAKGPWMLPFAFMPDGRAHIFSAQISPFPEFRETPAASVLPVQPPLPVQRPASQVLIPVNPVVERDTLIAGQNQLKYLSINDAYRIFFSGEALLVSRKTFSELGAAPGGEVMVTIESISESRKLSIVLSDVVADNCAVIVSHIFAPRVVHAGALKAKITRVL